MARAMKGRKGFVDGRSGNPSGRPRGSRNKTTMMAQALFDEQGQAIVEKIIELALERDDKAALKICVDRLVPPRRSRPLSFALPRITSAQDVVAGFSTMFDALSPGQLTLEEASTLAGLLESMRRAIETTDYAEQLARIEAKLEPGT